MIKPESPAASSFSRLTILPLDCIGPSTIRYKAYPPFRLFGGVSMAQAGIENKGVQERFHGNRMRYKIMNISGPVMQAIFSYRQKGIGIPLQRPSAMIEKNETGFEKISLANIRGV